MEVKTDTEVHERSPVTYMKAAEKQLGRSMTTLEAGEIYGAWQRAVPLDEIVGKIQGRDA